MAVDGYWTYTESGGNAYITDYDTAGGYDITIPTTLGGYPVVEVDSYALSSKSLTSITIEHAINLDDNCFSSNSGVSVTLDANVTTSVSSSVPPFEGCSIGSGLTITSNVTSIPNYLFHNSGLTSVILPISITTIGYYAFSNNSITSIDLDSVMNLDDNCFANNSGIDVTLDANVTTSVSSSSPPFEGCSIGTGITITSNVTTIPNYLFSDCGLTSLSLPSSIISVGYGSFQSNSLTSLTLPLSLTSIGYRAFYNNSITEIDIDHVMNLDDECFAYNTGIDVNLDANVTTSVSSGSPPFEGCSIGTGLTITSNVTTIPNYLFYTCGLTSLSLPSSIVDIGYYVFANNSISAVTLSSAMDLDDNCFANNSGIEVTLDANVTTSVTSSVPPFENCNIGSGLTITSNVTAIDDFLFRTSGLTSATLPSSVTIVNQYAFSDNANLADFYVYNNATSFGSNVLTSNMSAILHGTVYGETGSTAETLASDYPYYDFAELAYSVIVEITKSNIQIAGNEISLKRDSIFSSTKSNIQIEGNTINFKRDSIFSTTKSNIQIEGNEISLKINQLIILTKSNIQIEGNDISINTEIAIYTALWKNQRVIYDTLSNDSTFMSLISNKLLDEQETDQDYPYVSFGIPTEIPFNTLNRIGFEDTFTMFIHTKPYGLGWYTAYTILDRMNYLLNGKRLTMTGLSLIYCKLDKVIKEKNQDKRILHVRYRLWNQMLSLNTP